MRNQKGEIVGRDGDISPTDAHKMETMLEVTQSFKYRNWHILRSSRMNLIVCD
jgi:hypothetical protein